MSFLDALRRGKPSGSRDDAASDAADPTGADAALTGRYRKLGERQAIAALGDLNQAELTTIDGFERSNRGREAVLNKLRYLRRPEPLPDYDTLDSDAIAAALEHADIETVKAVREYERKLQGRPAVLAVVASAIQRAHARRTADAAAAGTSDPPVPDNGFPIKVRPETGLGAP